MSDSAGRAMLGTWALHFLGFLVLPWFAVDWGLPAALAGFVKAAPRPLRPLLRTLLSPLTALLDMASLPRVWTPQVAHVCLVTGELLVESLGFRVLCRRFQVASRAHATSAANVVPVRPGSEPRLTRASSGKNLVLHFKAWQASNMPATKWISIHTEY